ncbi:glyoxalase [Cronobacter sakazakii]|uniref:glyoxalase n=1 Tax=Cronobacter sakazakii TaxID=28141 RepID=UPI0013758B94|nr:glyoxalase [Cronobacter sakazakii]ELY3455515.1 glyoxalase [Cronobacter sakazakii]ELY4028494.1 glyoxalase [Cronobacter sakazakii]ELY5801630.1 glyoxalase [Cronobacter sakazakii]NCH33472.1 glyoxalase [Cronobacter sakazakii]NUW62869.1 glyoxalase [Cronobacter sakazakii]
MNKLPGVDVLFVAGFGPVSQSTPVSAAFYIDALGLPLKPMEGNSEYLLAEEGALNGVAHFAVWPLAQAASACFGVTQWPVQMPVPQGWVEYEVDNLESATRKLREMGYHLLVENREEPWGQTVTRLLSPEGLLTGLTVTPWLRHKK